MRDLTDKEQIFISGANVELPISLPAVGALVLGAAGKKLGGEAGRVAGAAAGLALGQAAQNLAREWATPPQTVFDLPMHGTPTNWQYGGGFS